jgi:hypothetical protein
VFCYLFDHATTPGERCLRASSKHSLTSLALYLSLSGLLNHAHAQQQPPPSPIAAQLPNSPGQSSLGTISGTIADRDGALIADAQITLAREGQPPPPERIAISDNNGRFSFPNVAPGPFKLTLSATGFAPRQTSGDLHPGETYEAPQVSLPSATTSIDMQVTASQQEIAQAQIQAQEKQRVLGVIPNFYVSYIPNPAPLTPKQKFELAWKTNFDPVTFVATGLSAGIQQARNDFSGYGQGAPGYAKRYAASYGNFLFANLIGNALLPSIFKQDPRYFYKGTGSTRSRTLYALANAVICKGDNGHWQPNYSGILGSAAAGGISNLYYPAANRNGASLTIANTAVSIAGSAVGNLFQEFLVRKLTPHAPGAAPAKP